MAKSGNFLHRIIPSLRDKPHLLLVFCGVFVLRRLVKAVPDHWVYADPFPFFDFVDEVGNKVPYNVQYYWYHIGDYLQWIAVFWIIWHISDELFSNFGKWGFWLMVADMIDFILRYNKGFFMLFGWNISYTDFQLFGFCIMAYVFYHKLKKWNKE